MTSKVYLAVTQLELNLQLSDGSGPTRHSLQALVLDPSANWRPQRLDLRYPGSDEAADTGQFAVSASGDLDGDGRSELVYAVTIDRARCHILAFRHDGSSWRPEPVIKGMSSVDLIRSIALGDLDQDGADEIVLGTRPSGAVLILDRQSKGYVTTIIDRDQYGDGSTNTREVVLADVDSDGALEVLTATARASSEKWEATPGALFLYRRARDGWQRFLIDDHGGCTHSRMAAVADVMSDGVCRIVASAVGVVHPASNRIIMEPELRMYTLNGERVECRKIDILENMIKSRSFAAGDIDGNGATALVVGTRALGSSGSQRACLFVYRLDADTLSWQRETLDTTGPLGFHCVAIADVDGDGRSEVIASDDGRGLIKLYKKRRTGWEQKTIYAARGPIFCSAIHLTEDYLRPRLFDFGKSSGSRRTPAN